MATPTVTETIRDQTRAIACGDMQAFAHFYRQWFDFVFLQARRGTGRDEQFCLDMVQETMLRVIRFMKPIDSDRALRAWLRTVVRSCCHDELRRERRRRKREFATDRHQSGTSNELLESQLVWLQSQLAAIGPDRSRLLTLRFGLQWTLKQIGVAMDLTAGAVDGQISRSLDLLRKNAQENGHE